MVPFKTVAQLVMESVSGEAAQQTVTSPNPNALVNAFERVWHTDTMGFWWQLTGQVQELLILYNGVITTNFGSIEDYIVKDHTSFVVDNLHCFKSMMYKVFKFHGKSGCAEVGKNNNAHINNNFSWRTIAEKHIKVYKYE